MVSIAVTGADGFIGRHFCAMAESAGHTVLRIVRRSHGLGQRYAVADLTQFSGFEEILTGVDAVVHLAGRAHVLKEMAADPEKEFFKANVVASENLAEGAIRAGVRRFVFVSSIGVHGNATYGSPFTELDVPAPVDLYARSKMEAEQRLSRISADSRLEVAIVRPSLVYGPGASGNFARLLSLAASRLPLPLASLHNRRNLIGRSNLCALLELCVTHPAAAGETFLAAEPQARSTAELIAVLRQAMGIRAALFPVPPGILRACARSIGMLREFDKLAGSLEISAEKAMRILSWSPVVSFEDEMRAAALEFVRRS